MEMFLAFEVPVELNEVHPKWGAMCDGHLDWTDSGSHFYHCFLHLLPQPSVTVLIPCSLSGPFVLCHRAMQ